MKAEGKIGNFIDKLQSLLENHHYSHIIHWNNDRTVIEISNLEKMQHEIIPLYFRHRKFESFVRQLNLYGFRKLKAQGKHRFTHEQLQLGKGLASVTSVKFRTKEGQENSKDEGETQGKTSENVELLMGSWRKMGSSAFRVYNPENRSNILLTHKKQQRQERRPLLEGQNTQEYLPISAPSFFLWNFMDFFNKNLFAAPITSPNLSPQPSQILQQ